MNLDEVQHCSLCGRMIQGRYAMVQSKVACVSCAARERDAARRISPAATPAAVQSGTMASTVISSGDPNPFVPAVLFGTVAALAGLFVYASFTIVTGWYVGYVAVGVGWMVGKAMMHGSGGVGGMRYQAVAVVLTYAAISLASIPIHIAHAASHATSIDWATMWGPLLLAGIASPFLELATGSFGIIGLAILFFGLRIAFRLTSEKQPKAATV